MLFDRRTFLSLVTTLALLPAGRNARAAGAGATVLGSLRDAHGHDRPGRIAAGGAIPDSAAMRGRGHGGVWVARRREAVLIARRPGQFALVLDPRDLSVRHTMLPPEGRHFFGHGALLENGLLSLTENHIDSGEGHLGLYDPQDGYARVGSMPLGQIGPHEVISLVGGRALAVAQGGIRTHPDTGRAKLNLETMRSTVDIVDTNGARLYRLHQGNDLRLLSLRHLAVAADGTLVVGGQWQGMPTDDPPLVVIARPGQRPQWLRAPEPVHKRMANYCGSVAVDGSGRWAAITAPRGGLTTFWRVGDGTGAYDHAIDLADVCGVAPLGPAGRFRLSAGTGAVVDHDAAERRTQSVRPAGGLAWDNHLTPIG